MLNSCWYVDLVKGPSFNTENEAMRKIDSICSQLASRNQTVIKEEPVSPDLSPVDSKRLSPLSCSSGRPPGRFLNSLCNADHHGVLFCLLQISIARLCLFIHSVRWGAPNGFLGCSVPVFPR